MKKHLLLFPLLAITAIAYSQQGDRSSSVFGGGDGTKKNIYSIGAYLTLNSKENYSMGINGEFKVLRPTKLFNKESEQLNNSFFTTTLGLYSVPEQGDGFGFFNKGKSHTINVAYLSAGYRYYFGVYSYDVSNPWQWFLESNLGLGFISTKYPAINFSIGGGFSLSRHLDGHVFYSGFYNSDIDKPIARSIGGFSLGLAYKFQ